MQAEVGFVRVAFAEPQQVRDDQGVLACQGVNLGMPAQGGVGTKAVQKQQRRALATDPYSQLSMRQPDCPLLQTRESETGCQRSGSPTVNTQEIRKCC